MKTINTLALSALLFTSTLTRCPAENDSKPEAKKQPRGYSLSLIHI